MRRSTYLQPTSARGSKHLLNPQQQAFVSALLADKQFNGTKAARAAGYAQPGVAAPRLLKNKHVAQVIGNAIKKRMFNLEIDAERVLEELSYIGFANPKNLFDDDGTLLNIKDMPDEIACAISGFDVETKSKKNSKTGKLESSTVTKIRFWSKNNALELIAKHLGMLDERFKVEHGVDTTTTKLIAHLLAKVESRNIIVDEAIALPAPEVEIEEGEDEKNIVVD